jgi:hypothetical protein
VWRRNHRIAISRIALAEPKGFSPPGSAQWTCNLSTTGLAAGTYVVQIQFWDGRILEAAFVLS